MTALQQELRKSMHYLSMRKREQAANRIDALEAENKRLREALTEYDALIRYQYTGSREAMHALTKAAQNGFKALETT